jgi:hypothetical protein
MLAACYRPSAVGECTATCVRDTECPGELACGTDGLCRDRGGIDCRDRPPGDAFPDVLVGNDAMVCFGGDGTSKLQATFCPTAFPVGAQLHDFSTDVCSETGMIVLPQNPGSEVCLVYAEMIVASAAVHVTGTRPLVLASAGDIMISGGVDVSSTHPPSLAGAGASFEGCPNTPGMDNANGGASGGAGGSFGGTGGGGGRSTMTVNTSPGPAVGSVDFVRGGCPGGNGGVGAGGEGGFGGVSAGAVYMIAKRNIVVSGFVAANGAGGGGAAPAQGGHGGGSGGLIGFEAASITIGTTGVVTAMGGGGGAGGSAGSFGPAGNDADGATPAQGGVGSSAGNGGAGSKPFIPGDASAGADTSLSTAGGGGGGGGAGVILFLGPLDDQGLIHPQ